jgi:hypothetical protein
LKKESSIPTNSLISLKSNGIRGSSYQSFGIVWEKKKTNRQILISIAPKILDLNHQFLVLPKIA